MYFFFCCLCHQHSCKWVPVESVPHAQLLGVDISCTLLAFLHGSWGQLLILCMHCVVRVSPRRKSWCLPAVKKAAQGLLHTSNTATIRSDHNHSCCVWPFFPRSLTCCSQIFIFLSSLLDTVSFLLCIYSCLKYIDISTRVF